MKPLTCPRKWQVEAVRDRRLTGKDLDGAIRHRELCAECAEEARKLAALGNDLAGLPEMTREALPARRTRQRLMAAFNESVLEPPRAKAARRTGLLFALGLSGAAVLVCSLEATRKQTPARTESTKPVVEVRAAAGARWSESNDGLFDQLDLSDGSASFKVRPHPGRRVVVRLPDGEVEDMGTVFEIRVSARHTQHVAVAEGRVVVRLSGQPSFELSAGQGWDAPSAALVEAGPALVDSKRAALPAASARGMARRARPDDPAPGTGAPPATTKQHARDAGPQIDGESSKAEDIAYLRIVDLLRRAEYAQARTSAKAYLLRFPRGFRRIEVLNIATRDANDAPDAASR